MPESAGPKPPGLSIFFPAYNDSGTIASMVIRAFSCGRATPDDEVIGVNDGRADRPAECGRARTYLSARGVVTTQERGLRRVPLNGFRSGRRNWWSPPTARAYDPDEL